MRRTMISGLLVAGVLIALLLVGHAQGPPHRGARPSPAEELRPAGGTALKCASCGKALDLSWKYCPWCGVKVPGKPGDIRVRTLTFPLDGDLDEGGEGLLESLLRSTCVLAPTR